MQVQPSEWDPPEHLSLSECEFLVDRAETIISKTVAYYIQVGQVLLQVKRKFKNDPKLDGWFKSWVEETLPFAYVKAVHLARIAEECEEFPELVELALTHSYKVLYESISSKGEFKKGFIDLMSSGAQLVPADITAVKSTPEYHLASLQEKVSDLEMTILRAELKAAGATTTKAEHAQKTIVKRAKERLAKALSKLQETEVELKTLGQKRSAQELVLQQLKKQLQAKDVLLENTTLDPEQKRKRALAQTVVDATKGLDLLLSSLDRYGTDKPELGTQAIDCIERKMEEVKLKLLNHYANPTT